MGKGVSKGAAWRVGYRRVIGVRKIGVLRGGMVRFYVNIVNFKVKITIQWEV